MGFYIETPEAKGKADYLIANHEAKEVPNPFAFSQRAKDEVPIVVVDNGPFEAVGICYSEREMLEFCSPFERRPRRFLLMKRHEVISLCPRVENYLEEF